MNQRERFEAAWLASEKAEGDHAVLMFKRSEYFIGKYFDIEVEAAWQSFQLGEASGLELAAKVCDEWATQFEPSSMAPAIDHYSARLLRRLATGIRALLAVQLEREKQQ